MIDALADGWGFDVEAVEYAAVGAGSYHWVATDAGGERRFVTVDDLDQKQWLGETRDAACEALGARLRHGRRAPERRASSSSSRPSRTSGGESLRRIGHRHTVALFPFVEGRGAAAGGPTSPARAPPSSRCSPSCTWRRRGRLRAQRVGLELAGRRRARGGPPGGERDVVGRAALRAGAAGVLEPRRRRAPSSSSRGGPSRRRGREARSRVGGHARRAARRERDADRYGAHPRRLGHRGARRRASGISGGSRTRAATSPPTPT